MKNLSFNRRDQQITHLAKTHSTPIGCDDWRKGHSAKWLEKAVS